MPGQNSRKQAFRLYVKCSICLKDIQEDNFLKQQSISETMNLLRRSGANLTLKSLKLLSFFEQFEESSSLKSQTVNSGKETMNYYL